jgi:dihydrofolate reductase
MKHDLIDELRLAVFPIALGAGERLFGETSDERPLRPIDTKIIASGLAHLTYESAREARGSCRDTLASPTRARRGGYWREQPPRVLHLD